MSKAELWLAAIASLVAPIVIVGSIGGMIQVQDSTMLLIVIIVSSLVTIAALRRLFARRLKMERMNFPTTLALAGLVVWLGSSLITGPLFGMAAVSDEGTYQIRTTVQFVLLLAASVGQAFTALGLLLVGLRLTRELRILSVLRLPLRWTMILSSLLLFAMSVGVLDAIARVFHHISVLAFLGFTLMYSINAIFLALLFVMSTRREPEPINLSQTR